MNGELGYGRVLQAKVTRASRSNALHKLAADCVSSALAGMSAALGKPRKPRSPLGP